MSIAKSSVKIAALMLAFALPLLLVACGGAPRPDVLTIEGTGAHTVVEIQGEMAVRHQKWRSSVPVVFGTILAPHDVLSLSPGAQATIVCDDLTTSVTLSASDGPQPICSTQDAALTTTDRDINPLRSQEGDVILVPRDTTILSQPVLRLYATKGIAIGVVRISGPGIDDWEALLLSQDLADANDELVAEIDEGAVLSLAPGDNRVLYPDDAPPFQLGENYMIRADIMYNDDDVRTTSSEGSLRVLSTDEQKRVDGDAAKIRALGLSPAATRLLLARLYEQHSLFTHAIDVLLHERDKSAPPQPAELRILGDLYVQVGFNQLASEAYDQALEQTASTDSESIAWNSYMFGKILSTAGLRDKARPYLDAALTFYTTVGDSENVDEINKLLE